MLTAQQLDDFVKMFGWPTGLLLIFIFGLRLEWWYLSSSVKAMIAGKDSIIAILTTEVARERELNRTATQQVRETVDWVWSRASDVQRKT